MSVRSLSVVVVGARGDACRALVSRARVHVRGHAGGGRSVHARLGALALSDLAPRAPLWRDRLRTRTTHALTIQYNRSVNTVPYTRSHYKNKINKLLGVEIFCA